MATTKMKEMNQEITLEMVTQLHEKIESAPSNSPFSSSYWFSDKERSTVLIALKVVMILLKESNQ